MSNSVCHCLRVRGEPAAITDWFNRATAPTDARYADTEGTKGNLWRMFHNLYPVPASLLAKPWREGGDDWEFRRWGAERVYALDALDRVSGKEIESRFQTRSNATLKWVEKVAGDFPELEFELFWDEDCGDHGRDLYRAGERVERWSWGSKVPNLPVSVRVHDVFRRYLGVLEEVNGAIAERPDDLDLYLIRAKVIEEGDEAWEEPEEWNPNQRADDLQHVLALAPDTAEVYLELVKDHLKHGDAGAARGTYERAIEQCPDNAQVRIAFAEFLGNQKGATRTDLELRRDLLRQVLALDPSNLAALEAHAFGLFDGEDYAGADEALGRVLELAPTRTAAHFRRALSRFYLDKYAEALDSVARVEENGGWIAMQNQDVLVVRAWCLERTGQTEQAIGAYTACFASVLKPNTEQAAKVRLCRARCYARLGQYSEAAEDVREATRLQPENIQFRAQLAEHLLQAGRFADARVALDALGSPENLNYHPLVVLLTQADVLRETGRDTLALGCARLCADRFPESSLAFLRQATILVASPDASVRNGEEALRVARIAGELEKWESAACQNVFALALAECGNFTEAAEWQKKALEKLGNKDDCARSEYLCQLVLFQSGKPFRFASKAQ